MSDSNPPDHPLEGPPVAGGPPDSPQPGWYPPPGDPPPVVQPSNGIGLASLIVGIVAILLAIFLFPLGILLGIVAVVLGIVGRSRAKRGRATNRGQATAGLVTGIVAVVIGGLIAVFVGNFLADNADEITELSDCLQSAGDADAQADCRRRFESELSG